MFLIRDHYDIYINICKGTGDISDNIQQNRIIKCGSNHRINQPDCISTACFQTTCGRIWQITTRFGGSHDQLSGVFSHVTVTIQATTDGGDRNT